MCVPNTIFQKKLQGIPSKYSCRIYVNLYKPGFFLYIFEGLLNDIFEDFFKNPSQSFLHKMPLVCSKGFFFILEAMQKL